MDGKAVRSCMTPVSRVAGHAVTTIEGLASGATPHRVQAAFIAEQAAQCGYCTSGMIMAAAAFLSSTPSPTIDQARLHLAVTHQGAVHTVGGTTPIGYETLRSGSATFIFGSTFGSPGTRVMPQTTVGFGVAVCSADRRAPQSTRYGLNAGFGAANEIDGFQSAAAPGAASGV
jgi:[2Fe-2S] binding domain